MTILLADKCPGCSDLAIKQVLNGEWHEPAWVAEGWTSEDYDHSQEIDFCPFCGVALPSPPEPDDGTPC